MTAERTGRMPPLRVRVRCVTPLASAPLRLAARADLAVDACALPRTYAGQEAEGDETPYPGCVTPLAYGSLRAPTLRSALARFLGRTPGRRRRETRRLTRAV